MRDFIPEIIKNEGKNPDYCVASEDEYLSYLSAKLEEETHELVHALLMGSRQDVENEMADVYEVLVTIMANKGTRHPVDLAREKRCGYGGFDKKLLLKVDKPSN